MSKRSRDWMVCRCACHAPGSYKRHMCGCGWCGHCQLNIAGNMKAHLKTHTQVCATQGDGMSASKRRELLTSAARTYRR